MVNAAQIRAARAALGWKQFELAERAGISARTMCDLENETKTPRRAVTQRIVEALENAGVEFVVSEDGAKFGIFVRQVKKESAPHI